MKQIDAYRALNLFNRQYRRFLDPKNSKKRKRLLKSMETLAEIVIRDKKTVETVKTNIMHRIDRLKDML